VPVPFLLKAIWTPPEAPLPLLELGESDDDDGGGGGGGAAAAARGVGGAWPSRLAVSDRKLQLYVAGLMANVFRVAVPSRPLGGGGGGGKAVAASSAAVALATEAAEECWGSRYLVENGGLEALVLLLSELSTVHVPQNDPAAPGDGAGPEASATAGAVPRLALVLLAALRNAVFRDAQAQARPRLLLTCSAHTCARPRNGR